MSFLNKNINLLVSYERKIIFLIFFCFTLILSIIYSYYFFKQFPDFFYYGSYDIKIEKIPFGYGNLLNNIFTNNKYATSETFHLYNDNSFIKIIDIDFSLKKLPFFTYLLFFLLYISKNIFFLIIFKNLIFFNIFYFITYYCFKSLNLNILSFFLLLFFFLFVPYNFKTFSEISYADSVTSILLGCLFLISISKIKFKFICLGICLFILYLTKESMFAICLIFPILIAILEFKKHKYTSLIPIIFVFIAIMSWGVFGHMKTGNFPFGSSLSTWKSYDMSKAFDYRFPDYYPKFSTDFIDTNIVEKEIFDEWDFYNYYKLKNVYIIKNDYKIIFNNIFLKIKFILFNIKPDGYQYKSNINSDILFISSSLLNKFIFYLAMGFLIYIFISKKYSKNKFEFYYLILISLNIAPHLIGWATSKHLIGMYLISFIFVILFIINNFYPKRKKNL